MNEIKKTTLHPDGQPNTDLYPKTSTDQIEGLNNITTGINNEIEGLNNIITGINNEIEKKVNTVDNFVKVFTIPNGVHSGTLSADIKQKLCNPDGHNYYVFDDTSQMILKYSFNADDEIIQYKAIYFQPDTAYEITMQILLSNGSWRRSQTVLDVPTSAGEKWYMHKVVFEETQSSGVPIQYGGAHIEFMFLSPSTAEFNFENFFGNEEYPDPKSPYFNIICYMGNNEGILTYGYNWMIDSSESQVYAIFFYKLDITTSRLNSDDGPTLITIDGSRTINDTVTEL